MDEKGKPDSPHVGQVAGSHQGQAEPYDPVADPPVVHTTEGIDANQPALGSVDSQQQPNVPPESRVPQNSGSNPAAEEQQGLPVTPLGINPFTGAPAPADAPQPKRESGVNPATGQPTESPPHDEGRAE